MKIFIEPYSPVWKEEFEKIKQVIEVNLYDVSPQADIQHVGSTSIQGLFAKPILDIDIILDDKKLLNKITSSLEKIGYSSEGEQGIPGRFVFRQKSEETPLTTPNNKWLSHHLYVCYADSLALRNHLLFRDILKANENLKERYSELKKSLVKKRAITIDEYTTRKTNFIISVLTTAGLDENELQQIINVNT